MNQLILLHNKRLFSPDANTGGSSATPGIPAGDVDFLSVAKTVATAWAAAPAITLAWISPPQVADLIANYQNFLLTRLNERGSRAIHTQKLKNMDVEIDKTEEEVKAYIAADFGKDNATAYYNDFGMINEASSWGLPRDKTERSIALAKMIDGIVTHGFSAKKYGQLYWTNMKAAYDDSLTAANSIDGIISENVGEKNVYRLQINEWMVALRFVLRGNYPKTYQQVYRQYGWQKEDY